MECYTDTTNFSQVEFSDDASSGHPNATREAKNRGAPEDFPAPRLLVRCPVSQVLLMVLAEVAADKAKPNA